MSKKFDKIDITLTDFIYAVVVGSAFQRIDAPIFSYQNLALLLAFLVVIDDWVLYHAQAVKVPDKVLSFTKSLIIDSLVLITWYCAAISGAHVGNDNEIYMRDFYIFLAVFYLLTCIWEYVFKDSTNNSSRIIPDCLCVYICVCAVFAHGQPWFLIVAPILFVLWVAIRAHAWRRIIIPVTN